MSDSDKTDRPDFSQGIDISALPDGGMLGGRVGEEDVLLARAGKDLFAVGAHCTHYHGPLADGLLVGDTVRCPWHHACFNLRTGEAVRAPALDPIACWRVERQGGKAFVREKLPEQPSPSASMRTHHAMASIAIVGGGAAALAAADMLRREGYDGAITMMSADDSPPTDRPNLSKDYLAGQAQDDWIPLRPPEFYAERRIELLLGSRVSSIDVKARELRLEGGARRKFDGLLLATGADPVHLPIPGADAARVHYLRSFQDSRALIEKAQQAKHVLVVGASFIGLEVAASLRSRGIDVDVVGPERVPLERVMGQDVGRFIQTLHEAKGVTFHLGQTVERVDGRSATLSGGAVVDVDFLVLGVGVRPATALAESSGLALDRGIAVNEYPRDERARNFRCGRCGTLARSPHGRPHPRRALGCRRTSGPGRRSQLAGTSRPLRCRPVFLESTLRCDHQLRRSRGAVGLDSDRRRARLSRLFSHLLARRSPPRGRHGWPRSGEPAGRARNGAGRGRSLGTLRCRGA